MSDSLLVRSPKVTLLAAVLSLPLVFTSGAGAADSRSFGMPLFGGYLLFALVGLLIARALTGQSVKTASKLPRAERR